METKTYVTIDRRDWPAGPWDNEPDKVQWQDKASGLPCLAVRNRHLGNWCGYVGVDESHPLHGKDYGDVDVDVHGGLSFADRCSEGAEAQGICHVPGEGEPDHVWWFGFDCGHYMDLSPYMSERYLSAGLPVTYRTLSYVQRECAKLAAQLGALK